ncbi:MAG: hypothetical protein ACLQI7_15330 [Streptosporangiaceae bacterium]
MIDGSGVVTEAFDNPLATATASAPERFRSLLFDSGGDVFHLAIGDPGDVGNWGYLLGSVSLIVEGSFMVLAVICLARIRRAGQLDPQIGERRSHADA